MKKKAVEIQKKRVDDYCYPVTLENTRLVIQLSLAG